MKLRVTHFNRPVSNCVCFRLSGITSYLRQENENYSSDLHTVLFALASTFQGVVELKDNGINFLDTPTKEVT